MGSKEEMPGAADAALDALFRSYRAACPDVAPSPNFMPLVWQRIEARRSFWFAFYKLGRNAVTASAALFLLFLALNLFSTPQITPSYPDALIADGSAEQTYYAEAIRSSPAPEDVPSSARH